MSAQLDLDLSPLPILDALDAFRGRFVDLDDARVVTWSEVLEGRESLAREMRARGLLEGDRAVVAVSNGAQFVATLAAILSCNACPLVLHSQTPPAELKRTALRFGARVIVSDVCEPASLQAENLATNVLPVDAWLALTWSELDDSDPAFQAHDGSIRGVPLHPTSGSTGLPKVALRPGDRAVAEAAHYTQTMGITEEDLILALPPMSHAYGYGMCAMVPLVSGASVVTFKRFSLKRVERALEEHAITILPTVPATLDVLSFGSGAAMYKRLRWVLTAGSLLTERIAADFKRRTDVTACALYGTTETGGISVATSLDGSHVGGRVGPPMEGVEVDVREAEEPLNVGEGIGRLWIRSSSMMTGYLEAGNRVTSPIVDGWFQTGDLAKIDGDGTINLRGRESEMINVCGLKVIPCEVEDVLACMPAVREVKVYPGTLKSGSQTVKAAVVPAGDLTVAEVKAYCEHHLIYYKRPQVVTLLDALPRSPTGKILRDQLP